MNIDIRLSVEFFDHPKTVKLKRRLGLEGVFSLQHLWVWAAQNRPNGALSGLDEESVEIAARWEGEEGKLVTTLLDIQYMERDVDGTYVLHGWEDHQQYASKAEERREKAQKAAQARWGKLQTENETESPTFGTNENNGLCSNDATSNAQACSEHPQAMPQYQYKEEIQGGEYNACARVDRDSSLSPSLEPEAPDPEAPKPETPPVHSGQGRPQRDGRPRTDSPSKGHPAWQGFLSCWQVYPRKQGKEAAWREWMRLHENGTLEDVYVIRDAILTLQGSDSSWARGKIPLMERWLRDKRWNDEPFVEPAPQSATQAHAKPIARTVGQQLTQQRQTIATMLMGVQHESPAQPQLHAHDLVQSQPALSASWTHC